MKKIVKLLGIVVAVLIALALPARIAKADTTVTVGVMTLTDSDKARWDKIQELLGDDITLKFVQFTDYSQPNKALANGEVDINAFQHYNFLNNWNKETKGNLVTVAETYISPIHLFSGTKDGKATYKKVSELPKGAEIAIPNDATNGSRALYLLEAAGLIKLKVSGETLATVADIKTNKKKIKITEVDASQTARSLTSVDAAIINNSYAVPAGVDYKTSLYKEKSDKNTKQWINIIAAQKNWKKSDKAKAIKKLVKAYHTDDVKEVIEETSKGIDVPVW